MLKIARIAIKKNAAFSDCIVVFGVKPYIVAKNYISINNVFIGFMQNNGTRALCNLQSN